ncbi:hypothetical protein AGMMS50212_12740 [Spirochaetia bacterium]|nr:hypothetical protein AGMMS50212_12740 [Spirochaetia bacterium]
MFTLLNKFLPLYAVIFSLFSCAFADLSQIGITVNPAASGAILEDYKTPVWINFDTEMKKVEVEQLLKISYADGKVEGDIKWSGNTIYFTPVADWIPGISYILSLSGTVYALDGRDAKVSYIVPFFAVKDSKVPFITGFTPKDGESVGVTPTDGGKLKLVFSCAMDKHSVEDALSIDGISKKEYVWNDTGTELEVYSKDALNAWTVYHWSISSKALSAEGTPLYKSVSAQWTTDKDLEAPKVKKIYPLLRIDDDAEGFYWRKTGLEIEDGLGSSQAIGISFSKSMDRNSMISCMRFEPSISGNVEQISSSEIVFIPSKNPEIGTNYRIIVSGEVKDEYGLKMADDYSTVFTVNIPYLEIKDIRSFGTEETVLSDSEIINGAVHTVYISNTTGRLTTIIEFSQDIKNTEAKSDIVKNIRFEPFFTNSLSPVALRYAKWISRKLELEWDILEAGTNMSPHFYKLTFPGGVSGIDNGSGSYLKETLVIFMEAKTL